MSKLKVTTREIGNVAVFDLRGDADMEGLQEAAWKIQRNIRRHRLQRVILNLQKVPSLDEIGIRKLVAAFIRPQKSVIFGASRQLASQLEDTYLPANMQICPTEKEVAEEFGPFLFHKEEHGRILGEQDRRRNGNGVGASIERRRSKRMHVAIPLEVTLKPEGTKEIHSRAIATNLSEGGIYVEFLDLDTLNVIEALDPIEDTPVLIEIRPSANFPEECRLEGWVRRREMRPHGLGIGIEFKEPLK